MTITKKKKTTRTTDPRGYGISTTFYLPTALYERVVAVSDADQRSVSQVGVICLESHLPELESTLRRRGLLASSKKE